MDSPKFSTTSWKNTAAKEIIKKYSKDFDGFLTNIEGAVAKVDRSTGAVAPFFTTKCKNVRNVRTPVFFVVTGKKV